MCLRNSILVLGIFLITLPAARGQDHQDQRALEGRWRFVSSSGGREPKMKNLDAGRMLFQGNQVSFLGERDKVLTQGTYTLVAGSNPKAMDITLEKNGTKIVTQAIYEVSGDTLKLCHYLGTRASQGRPKEFQANEQCVLGILQREKK